MDRTRWNWIAVAVATTFAHSGCAADDEGGDFGSAGVGGFSSSNGQGAQSTPTSTSGVGGGGGSAATGGADPGGAGGAAGGGPYEACLDLCKATHVSGNETYDAFAECVYCGECKNDCDGGGYLMCTREPTGEGCDNTADCDVCSECAKQMSCARYMTACAGEPDCVEYANCIAQCGLL